MTTERTSLTSRLLNERLIVIALAVLGILAGLRAAPFEWLTSWERDPVAVDAIPDIGENQQIVLTAWPGRAPRIVEDQITYPLSTILQGLPKLKTVRGASMFGFSMVYLIFEDDAEFYWTRARITERLASLPDGALPEGVRPQIGPDATALGQVYMYTLEGVDPDGDIVGGWSLDELRSIQDFVVRYALAAAEGVSEVASLGGFVREALIELDPDAMRAYDITADEVVEALRRANIEVGAETYEQNGVAYMIRSLGYARDLDELGAAVVAWRDTSSVRVSDVARLSWGPAERQGALTVSGNESAGGIVTARYGANPREVISNVQREIDRLNPSLPSVVLDDGTVSKVQIVPFYDRSELIDRTVGTLEVALIQQVLITLLVVLVLLFRLRASLVVATLLPLSVLWAFVWMKWADIEANIAALAGIAIAIGTLVDMGIVLIDSIMQELDAAGDTREARMDAIARGTREVRGAIMTAMATTVFSFIPVFALQGQEGKLFGPLAWTKTLTLIASLIGTLVVLPVLSAVMMARPERGQRFQLPPIVHKVGMGAAILSLTALLSQSWMPLGASTSGLTNFFFTLILVGGLLGTFLLFQIAYPHILRFALKVPALSLIPMLVIVLSGVTVWQGFGSVWGWLPDSFHRSATGQWLHHEVAGLGREFMPQLDEGTFLYMPITMPHASIGSVLEVATELDGLFETIPEVERAISKAGRADTALDPAPLGMLETIVHVLPEYIEDSRGRRLRFAVDSDDEHIRDEHGELVPDPKGRPYRQWRPEITRMSDIWDEMVERADVAGLTSAPLLQPISTRIVMLQSGIRAPIAVQLSGADLESLGRAAQQLEGMLREHPLVNEHAVSADRPVGRAYLEIEPDRVALMQHGLDLATLQDTIATALGGADAGTMLQGRERYSIKVRYPRDLRMGVHEIERLEVPLPNGARVPLSQVATLEFAAGPEMISSEDARLVTYIMFDSAPGVTQLETVDAVTAWLEGAIADGRWSPEAGVSWKLVGTFENAVRAEARLKLLVPLVLLVVLVLLHIQFRSLWMSISIFTSVTLATSGGMLLLWFWGQPWFLDFSLLGASLRETFQVQHVNLSVAVWVGFIAMFGVATDDSVVMITYLEGMRKRYSPEAGDDLIDAIVEGATKRVRACLMTSATTILALMPILTSYGTGSDVMIPMSLPSIGGMITVLLALFMVPILYYIGFRLGAIKPSGAMPAEPNNQNLD